MTPVIFRERNLQIGSCMAQRGARHSGNYRVAAYRAGRRSERIRRFSSAMWPEAVKRGGDQQTPRKDKQR